MIYRWRKGIVTWVIGDTLNISVPFTWLLSDANKLAHKWKGSVKIGGPGIMQPSQVDDLEPILYHNPCATFSTRGCVNKCGFCAVPHLEGALKEIHNFRPAPLICDNNLLAASKKHIRYVVDQSRQFPFVDFNQGLEARRFTPEIADILGELNCKVRFAFDHWGQEAVVKDAIDLCRQRTTNDIQVYCLIGYDDTPESAQARLELIRSWNVLPNPMRYQPLDAEKRNDYVHPAWTDRQLTDMARYYSQLKRIGYIPFSEYNPRKLKEQGNR